MEWQNLDKLSAYQKLKNYKKITLKEVLTVDRIKNYNNSIDLGDTTLNLNYSCKELDDNILNILQELSNESQLIEKYQSLLDGEIINTGENRKVLHHLLRGQLSNENKDIREFYLKQIQNIASFSEKIQNASVLSSSNKEYKNVVQIGIGGSDLGPRAMYLALKGYSRPKLNAYFISNVDTDDGNDILNNIDLSATLFILVSKSGTTQETLANETLVVKTLKKNNIANPKKNIICVTSETSPLAKSKDYLTSFFIDDFIGGRYSSTSAVGLTILNIVYSKEIIEDFLLGASLVDKSALNSDIRKNPILLDALIGVYERNCLNHQSLAILPYSQALIRFPAHLQQLDMESNGKSVNRFNKEINYETGPIIFGEPGTNGQHSFYQLLHQGTSIVPMQFIAFKNNQSDFDIEIANSTSNTKLKANVIAQIVAFALGQDNENKNKSFKGQRPSSLIYSDALNPKTLGALLAYYENKIMFQGFLWNINSFDQEGVQLGKLLTNKVLEKNCSEQLKEFANILNI